MGVVTICSGKTGGVTTLALAVAARWPDAAPLLVEADAAGGDLGARFGLVPAPGLGSAAAAGRAGPPDAWVALHAHTQRLPMGVAVLLAPASFVQASAAVRALADTAVLAEAGRRGVVVVDAGRVAAGSPALPIAAGSDVVMVVTRPRWDEVAHAAATITLLRDAGATRVGLLLRAGGPLPAGQISQALGAIVVAEVGEDRLGSRVLCGELAVGPGWRRLGLARTGRGIATVLTRRVPQMLAAAGQAEVMSR